MFDGIRAHPILASLVAAVLLAGTGGVVATGEDEVLARAFAAYDAGDYGEAVTLWRGLADGGNVTAMTALANVLFQGEGLARDPAAAALWYRRAAGLGDAVAQLNLGDMYARGLGVAKDPVEAYFWLGLAAGQGNAWARERQSGIATLLDPTQVENAERRISEWKELDDTKPAGSGTKTR